MTARAVAALPPVEPLPAPAANAVEPGQRDRFLTFLAAAPRAAEHHAARGATRALGSSKAAATDDSSAAATAAAAAQTPAQSAGAAASAPASTASGSASPSDGKTPLPAAAALAAAALVADAAQTIAVPPPGATTLSPGASTQPGSSDSAPAMQPNASATAAATPIQSMAASLGLRLVSGAPNLAGPPRTPLASLTGPQDKTAADAPAGSHPALALELLQGAPKSAADPTADAAVKLIDATAKDILAIAPPTPAATEAAPSTINQPDTAAGDAAAAQLAGATSANTTPASATTASATTALPVMAHAVAEQVAIGLRQAVKGDVDHIQIQLQPAELGAIDVKLNVNHDGRVTMVVSADRSDTLNLLQQDASMLAQALRDAGLQADNSSLSFNLRGFQMNQQTAQGGSPWRGALPAGSGDDLGAVTSAMPILRRHSGALDIHV